MLADSATGQKSQPKFGNEFCCQIKSIASCFDFRRKVRNIYAQEGFFSKTNFELLTSNF